jgi:hypothetical protein
MQVDTYCVCPREEIRGGFHETSNSVREHTQAHKWLTYLKGTIDDTASMRAKCEARSKAPGLGMALDSRHSCSRATLQGKFVYNKKHKGGSYRTAAS